MARIGNINSKRRQLGGKRLNGWTRLRFAIKISLSFGYF